MGFVRFGKFGNEFEIESFKFPGGELQVRLPDAAKGTTFVVNVCACIQNSDDLMKLALACDALDAQGYRRINLIMPYVPYARQDRRCNENEAHSLKVFCRLINELSFYGVTVYDPHSDVVEALIKYINIVPQESIIKDFIQDDRYFVVSPDGGALKKIYKVAKTIDALAVIEATKQRNITTGAITRTKVSIPFMVNEHSDKFLVVDDICDGGRTFVELGKALQDCGIKQHQLELYVTHGIFSKGFDELLQHYSKIYTTNSFRQDINQESVEVFDIWN